MFRDSYELFCDADDDLLTIAAFLTCINSIHTHTHEKKERKGKKAPKVNKLRLKMKSGLFELLQSRSQTFKYLKPLEKCVTIKFITE